MSKYLDVNYIWITTDKVMFHKYPNAPDEVNFLKNLHRHLFKFKVYIQIKDNNRDIEFFMFKRSVKKYINKIYLELKESFSCEMFSDELAKCIRQYYPNRKIMIEISEDGENGSFKSYE